MADNIDVAKFDMLIDQARAKFRQRVASNPNIFGGTENRRVDATIGVDAPHGIIGVPEGINISTTQGLMAGIDLTLLNKAAHTNEIEATAKRACAESTATVCVYPEHVATIQAITAGHPPPIAVVGFPSVPNPDSEEATAAVAQTRAAIKDGAKEIDMVLAVNFKDGDPDYAAHYNYIRSIVAEAGQSNIPVKVILETAYLTDKQKVEASMLAKMAGATFVKTSTGFAQDELMMPDAPKGATPHDVALMRRTVGDTTLTDNGQEIPMGVKASGGVRTREGAIALYQAGASRIGASGAIDVRTSEERQSASPLASTGSRRQAGY